MSTATLNIDELAANEANIATVTRRTKSLGYGWTNSPQARAATPTIEQVTSPDVSGLTVTGVLKEQEKARRLNSGGNFWRSAFFVRGRRIVAVSTYEGWSQCTDSEVLQFIRMLKDGDTDEIDVLLAPEGE